MPRKFGSFTTRQNDQNEKLPPHHPKSYLSSHIFFFQTKESEKTQNTSHGIASRAEGLPAMRFRALRMI